MGYRSEVQLCISKEVYQNLTRLRVLGTKLPALFEDAEVGVEELFVNYSWYDIKWYDSYEDVSELTAFIDTIEDSDDYQFLRLGEESGDIEEHGDLDVMYVASSVEFY